jgi:hypothetical protein
MEKKIEETKGGKMGEKKTIRKCMRQIRQT